MLIANRKYLRRVANELELNITMLHLEKKMTVEMLTYQE